MKSRPHGKLPRTLFVTGTDTGVGKTLVTALLTCHLRSLGVDAAFMKCMASGCLPGPEHLQSEDVSFLQGATGIYDSLPWSCPVMLEEPLAPLVAARRAALGTSEWPRVMASAHRELLKRHEVVVVEGVGGLMVPLAEQGGAFYTCKDLLEELECPAIVVARRGLGTINHTLLTCRSALKPPAHFAGLVFSDAQEVDPEDVAAQTSPAVLAEMSGLPVLGQLPYRENLAPESVRELFPDLDAQWWRTICAN